MHCTQSVEIRFQLFDFKFVCLLWLSYHCEMGAYFQPDRLSIVKRTDDQSNREREEAKRKNKRSCRWKFTYKNDSKFRIDSNQFYSNFFILCATITFFLSFSHVLNVSLLQPVFLSTGNRFTNIWRIWGAFLLRVQM